MVEDFLSWCDSWGLREGTSINDGSALARQLFAGMRFAEQLLRNLAKIVDESNGGILFQRIINAVGGLKCLSVLLTTKGIVKYFQIKRIYMNIPIFFNKIMKLAYKSYNLFL